MKSMGGVMGRGRTLDPSVYELTNTGTSTIYISFTLTIADNLTLTTPRRYYNYNLSDVTCGNLG